MKLLLCFVVVVVAAIHAETVGKTPIQDHDAGKNVSEESLHKRNESELLQNPKVKEYIFWLVKDLGFIDDNGEFQVETIKANFKKDFGPPEKVDDFVAKCVVKKDTPQNSAFEFLQCMYHYTRVKN